MKAQLINTQDDQAIVKYEENGMPHAVAISIDDLPETSVGGLVELENDVVGTGTPHGITLTELEEAVGTRSLLMLLRNQNIFTKEDMIEHSDKVLRLAAANASKRLRMFMKSEA